jgi:predicted ABC-type ATPase
VNADTRPTLVVIAGPNGAGKSTFTASLGRGIAVPVIDPDAVARRLQPLALEEAAVQAGRAVLRQQKAYLEHNTSFAVETTLAGAGVLRLMDEARVRGYRVHLVYIGIENVQTTLDHIAGRAHHPTSE